jgi:hypothetical protein
MNTAGCILNTTAPGPEFVRVNTPEDVCTEIDSQAATGVDYIKIYSGLPPKLAKEAIECAHKHGLRVIGHLQATTWTEAAQYGIDMLSHAAPWATAYLDPAKRGGYDGSLFGRVYWLSSLDLQSAAIREMIATLASAHVAVDPTLIASHSKFCGDDPGYRAAKNLALAPEQYRVGWPRGSFTGSWIAEQYQAARQQWSKQLELVRLLYEGGVLLTVGTDTPTPWIVPGLSFHQELALLHDAGIPVIDVLRCATNRAAVALRKEREIGVIAPGFRADMVILRKNPLEDIRNTNSISMVILGGRIYAPSVLRARQ